MKITGTQLLAIFVGFLVTEIVTLLNIFGTPLPGGGAIDAERFHQLALDWMAVGTLEFSVNAEFYVQSLGILYSFTYPSQFIGAQFGILMILIAAIYMIKMGKVVGFYLPAIVILLFFIWPSMLLRSTTTMREPYIIALFILICYHALQFHVHGSNRSLFYSSLFCVIGFLFHKALTVFLMFFAIYVVFFGKKKASLMLKALVVAGIGAGIVLITRAYGDVRGLETLIATLNGDVDYMSKVLDSKMGRDAGATYEVSLNFSSPVDFLLSIPVVFTYYMFGPFPWNVKTIGDLYASFEGIVRFIALWVIVRHLFIGKRLPQALKIVAIMVLTMCMIWAAGTTNFGTANRHHITTNWFFIMILALYVKTAWRSGSRLQPWRAAALPHILRHPSVRTHPHWPSRATRRF